MDENKTAEEFGHYEIIEVVMDVGFWNRRNNLEMKKTIVAIFTQNEPDLLQRQRMRWESSKLIICSIHRHNQIDSWHKTKITFG